ncbi:MAG: GNAT family N-acetyltransferase [Pseudomonadota bacterium]
MPDATDLRTARPSDARRLCIFRRALHAQSCHLNALPHEIDARWLATRRILAAAQRSERSLFLIALVDGKVAAELQLRGNAYHRTAHDKRLALGVLKAYRGRGIGSALLEQAITWAKTQSETRRITLGVHSTNVAALALYTRAGFVEEGRRRGAIAPLRPQEPYRDEVMMAYSLEPKSE